MNTSTAIVVGMLVCMGAHACGHPSRRPRVEPRTPEETASVATWHALDDALITQQPIGLDSDGDTLLDEHERALRTDPLRFDTDGDGYDDGLENHLGKFGFDPRVATSDEDHDGLSDSFERRLETDPRRADSDGDGWGDFDEVLNARFGFDPQRRTPDSDFDGLSDSLEGRIGSNPHQADTNEDGILDFADYEAGFDPTRRPGGPVGELIGVTYSRAMGDALEGVRRGQRFPKELAGELPYPQIHRSLVVNGAVRPSAALMQRSLHNPSNSPPNYWSYATIVEKLQVMAAQFPKLVRLFYWTQPTRDCCDALGAEKPGRTIYAMKISDHPDQNENEREVLIMGMHHARELITTHMTVQFIAQLLVGYALGDPEARELVENAEIWVLPVVNPNGYERALGVQLSWRKNTRLISQLGLGLVTPSGFWLQWFPTEGVDLNRNYDFEHATSFTVAQRATLPGIARNANGISANGDLDPNSPTYPGPGPFSEVETQAVRGLAHSQFLTERRKEVDGLGCSLSWHTYGGVVGHPMGHTPTSPTPGLDPADVAPFGDLTESFAAATGYRNIRDTFQFLSPANGDPYDGYPVYGDSDDWLYKDRHTLAILVEAYSALEGQTGQDFYPHGSGERDAVSFNNHRRGAFSFVRACLR